jgi:hypothetical protein
MLRVSPAQRKRLIAITQNLAERITEARTNNWLGEVEGLQVSLEAARRKLVDLDRLPAPRQSARSTSVYPSCPADSCRGPAASVGAAVRARREDPAPRTNQHATGQSADAGESTT